MATARRTCLTRCGRVEELQDARLVVLARRQAGDCVHRLHLPLLLLLDGHLRQARARQYARRWATPGCRWARRFSALVRTAGRDVDGAIGHRRAGTHATTRSERTKAMMVGCVGMRERSERRKLLTVTLIFLMFPLLSIFAPWRPWWRRLLACCSDFATVALLAL